MFGVLDTGFAWAMLNAALTRGLLVLLLSLFCAHFSWGWFQNNAKSKSPEKQAVYGETSDGQDQSCFCHVSLFDAMTKKHSINVNMFVFDTVAIVFLACSTVARMWRHHVRSSLRFSAPFSVFLLKFYMFMLLNIACSCFKAFILHRPWSWPVNM